MPHIGITKSELGNNKGSCRALVHYLEKENYIDQEQTQMKPIHEQEHFFSQDQDRITPSQVIQHIDKNKKQLAHKDDKFFLVNISASQDELKHIGNDKAKLKEYTKSVMGEYAKNFNKGLDSQDLVWYAKLENDRTYKNKDKEVQEGLKKAGEKKEGLNTHVQVIVSRKCAENKRRLSPLNNSRTENKNRKIKGNTGFDRVQFKMKSIDKFDEMFQYQRQVNELERHLVMKNGTAEEKAAYQAQQLEKAQAIKQQQAAEEAQVKKQSKPKQQPQIRRGRKM